MLAAVWTLGVPNVYSINGRLHYETPTGDLSAVDPFVTGQDAAERRDKQEPEEAGGR